MTESDHGPACEGCQILTLMAERDAAQEALANVSVEQIIARMGSLSSAAIERIIVAGQQHQDERFADGVFE